MTRKNSNGQDAPWFAWSGCPPKASRLDGERESPVSARPTSPPICGRGAQFKPAARPLPRNEQMMIDEKTTARMQAELRRCFGGLFALDGIPVCEILAVAHAETISQVASLFGVPEATACAESALRQLTALGQRPAERGAEAVRLQ